MKTTAFWLLFLFTGFTMMAQVDSVKTFRPGKYNFSAEVNFKPFSADAPISINGFRGRLFLGNKLAVRLGCNFAMKKTYDEYPAGYGMGTFINSDDERYTVIGISSGLEYHFLNSKRFSPYAGVSIGFENKSSKGVYEDADYSGTSYQMVETEIKNAWGYYTGGSSNYLERGYTSIATNLVLGADVYIIKHLYLGLELGLGYNAIFYKKIEVTVDGNVSSTIPKAKESDFGINVNNSIRLGFWF